LDETARRDEASTAAGRVGMNVPQPAPSPEEPIVDLVPIVRRVVAARIADPATRDDIVQETLARVMASRSRVEHESLVPYAITTARNLIASLVQREQRARRNAHLFAEADGQVPRPEEELLRQEEASLVVAQSGSPPPTDRCRPVLIALSSGDRRRQRELDVHGHLLSCDFCADLSPTLAAPRARRSAQDDERIPVGRDADVVAVR